ncbi:MAG TPA: T9SS type A sorting domain-containing protein [Bacteroidia bacterium]|jgi:hypothetical protein|nr:T9SS type A sorting domain-containing protein [Bacteroidia bacterium]
MKKNLYILSWGLLPLLGIGQARVNITAGYMKIGVTNNGTTTSKTYFVIDDSASTGLKASAGTGIISSGEFNMVEWNIGKSTGAFTLPWISDNHTSIPLTATVNTAGVNSTNGKNASVEFSTWHTISDQASGVQSITGLPSDCNNMYAMYSFNAKPSPTDNSYNVADRFWIIDATSAAGKAYKAGSNPAISMSFTYLGSSNAATEVSSPNVLTDGSLIAQRFNPTINSWDDYMPVTTSDAAGASTSVLITANVPTASFQRDWTLTNKYGPLPIKLLAFTVQCQNNYALIQWSTATEINNDYFTIDRSEDGTNYQNVAVVKGARNSSSTLNYSAIDYNPMPVTVYYRLSQTDLDGHITFLQTEVLNPCINGNIVNAYSTPNYITVQISSTEISDNYNISLCNAIGQTVYSELRHVNEGINEFQLYPNVAEGVYFLTISNTSNVYHKKILIKK